ncbi:DUF4062 domain-containing protein [Rhizobium sp. BR 250]
MQEKRYQIFLSSTFTDLRAERQAVRDIIIRGGDFPIQMEDFPASDIDQLEYIKPLIEESDYYVLIIGGRYGTIADDGLSYTHKEYQHAKRCGVPVLVLLHGDLGSIPAEKSEETSAGRRRLNDFINEAQSGRLRNTWTNIDNLKLHMMEALYHAKAAHPRVGWVRGDSVASTQALEELNTVRKENEKFRDVLGNFSIEVPIPQLPPPENDLHIKLLSNRNAQGYETGKIGSNAIVKASWITLFPILYSNLSWSNDDYHPDEHCIDRRESCLAIGSAIAGEIIRDDTSRLFKISESMLDLLVSYYIEVGLMKTDGASPFTKNAEHLARRHLINNTGRPVFTIIEGEVAVSDYDDIPF